MMPWLRSKVDNFIGSGDAALAVPPMDGALKPNRALDACKTGFAIQAPDDLCVWNGILLVSSGKGLFSIQRADAGVQAVLHRTYENEITAIAADAAALAVAFADGDILIEGGRHDGRRISLAEAGKVRNPTAVTFLGAEHLAVCVGSARYAHMDWQRDLLERGSSGSVWRIDLQTEASVCLADGLAYPYGIMPLGDGHSILVSESWKHRLLRLDATRPSSPEAVLNDLPGYPARLHGDGVGGAWLALFAPRNQLVEFVMREPEYRDLMMSSLAPAYWIAPSLRSRGSFLEPLQGGGVRQMGMLKPWAPTRSYGLVIGLDRNLQPRRSLHSRADGSRHGTTSCLASEDQLIIASKGGNEILFCDLRGQS